MTTAVPPRGTLAKVLLIIFAVIFLLPGACGSIFYGATMFFWISSGFSSAEVDVGIDVIVIAIAALLVLVSIVLFGIILRISRWSKAPAISLWLAALAAFVILTAQAMMYPSFETGFAASVSWLFAASLLALLVCAVPPYLYWRSNR